MSGKDAAIADAKAVKWSHAEYTDMQVTVYGDTADCHGHIYRQGYRQRGQARQRA